MNNYNRNNRSGGGRFGGGDFRRGGSGRREMHRAVCDKCGKDCEVPFRPSGDKPIFCSNCFEGKELEGSRRPGGSDFGKRDSINAQLLEQVSSMNAKLDRILKVLESTGEKKAAAKKTKIRKVVEESIPEAEEENNSER